MESAVLKGLVSVWQKLFSEGREAKNSKTDGSIEKVQELVYTN
jgi:hypothetical protein